MAKTWQRGVSGGAAGRLGAHAAGFEPAENGYLTYQTCGATFMLIRPERRVIGALRLPARHEVEETTRSWCLRVARYRAPTGPAGDGVHLDVLASVVSPAVTFASDTDRVFRWRWPVRASPQWCAFPAGGGVTVAHYARGYPLRALDVTAARLFEAGPYDTRREPLPGPLRRDAPWMLTFDPRGRNVPVLWVFARRRPRQIDVTSYEHMDFHFAGPFGRIAAMPLYGSAEIDREELADIRRGRGLRALRARCDFWADAIRKLPDDIEDRFRILADDQAVEVRDIGSRIDGRRPAVCPVPPFLTAGARRYPVRIHTRPLRPPGGRDLYTHYGPYRLVRGPELRYTMRLCPYLRKVLSPVRVTGEKRAAALTHRLRAYFDDPRHTFGGDGTYDPDSLLDILHNLRVLAWAAWALPAGERPAARRAIVRGFARRFGRPAYRAYLEPVTGRTVARDRTIFDWCGDVTYDFDWYSGMNLAGLFAGVYFGAIPAEWVRRKWKLVCDIEAYFEVFQDWATLVPWTDMRGELLNIDCARHGAQGMIGFARLAERFGDARRRDLARYIATRYMVFWAAEHELPDLYAAGGVTTTDWGRGGGHELTLGFGGLRERDAAPSRITADARGPYTLSPLNPEHMLFLRDYGPLAKLRRYEAEVLDRAVPGWDRRPAEVYFAARPAGHIERNTGGYHFFMLDPHLFLRMLVLDWPARKAIRDGVELSGQVMAAALVADAPKVLCPDAVEFAGTEWDARRKVLTIRARADAPADATWEVLWPQRPRRVRGPRGARRRFRAGRLILQARCRGDIEWRIEYASGPTRPATRRRPAAGQGGRGDATGMAEAAMTAPAG